MNIEGWWLRIGRESRRWLEENNGDAVRRDIADEIHRAGGELAGSYLTDEEVDWVESVANGEVPDPPIVRDETR